MKYLLIIMFFFTLVGCQKNDIFIVNTNQIIVNKDIEYFELNVKTNYDDVILINVENNNEFEYELSKTSSGYNLNLIIYSPKSFSNITLKANNKEYICNIGKIEVLDLNVNNLNYINIVTDNNDIYIYNKLDKFIEVEDIKVLGGDYLPSINFSKFIDPKKLIYIGNIYTEFESYVILIKLKYNNQFYEQYFEIKNLTNF